MGSNVWHQLSENDNQDGSGIFDPRVLIFFETNNAKEWAPYHINVNCIAPGTIASEMVQGMIDRRGEDFIQAFPRKRLGYPDDLDSTLLFLVSPSSRFVTGTVIKADDGQLPR